jgi:creatinine amidohydrolase
MTNKNVSTRRIVEMTSPQFEQAVKTCDTLILPLASVEQGGGHCPLGTDLFTAEAVALLIAGKADALIAPSIPYGDALELEGKPGTVSVDSRVFESYVAAVAESFLRQGFRTIVFLCCHSLDLRAVDGLCRRLRVQGCCVGAVDWWKAVGAAAKGRTGSREPFGHCGEVITSAMLALAPGLVDAENAQEEDSLPGLAFAGQHAPGSPFVAYGTFSDYCRSGAWGEVKDYATAEKGRAWVDEAVEESARFIRELREALPPSPAQTTRRHP